MRKTLKIRKNEKAKVQMKTRSKKGLKKINFQDEKIETEKPKNKKKTKETVGRRLTINHQKITRTGHRNTKENKNVLPC